MQDPHPANHAAPSSPPRPARPIGLDAPPHPSPPDRTQPDPAQQAFWPIDPNITLLNHGSYGVVPRFISDRQSALRDEMNADPPRWFKIGQQHHSDCAREALAQFCSTEPRNITLVPNATVGMASVLQSLGLEPGDEVLLTDHEYRATINELDRVVRRDRARMTWAKVPFPLASADQVLESVTAALTPNTRAVVVSHIASASSVIFPVREIIALCRDRGIEVVVDGAHAVGQIPVDLGTLGATYYVASCHKWLCTPKGSGFIHAEGPNRQRLRPVAHSCRTHDLRPGRDPYLRDFDYVGTDDTTANLVIPDAIAHLGAQCPGGWPELFRRNHDLVIAGARIVADRCGLPFGAPEHLLASMVTLDLPPNPAPDRESRYDDPLWDALYERHRIQVPVWPMEPTGGRVVRLSAHLHNSLDQYERLADALAQELQREGSR